MDAVAAIGMGMQGSLEEQLGRLREYEEAVYQFKPHLEELERINQQIQESSDTLSTPWRPSEWVGSSWSPQLTGDFKTINIILSTGVVQILAVVFYSDTYQA